MVKTIGEILRKIKIFLTRAHGEFLCDSCKYDYPNACSNPNRPNAKHCNEYKSK